MKTRTLLYGLIFTAAVLIGLVFVAARPALAAPPAQNADIARGGALYDHWMAALGVEAPAGNMPIWDRQTNNTRSGPDTWRCVSCHGWDYQGNQGAYRSGTNFTGFPGVYPSSQEKSVDELVGILKGEQDPEHDFSPYLDDAALTDLATFLKEATVDDNEFIDMTTLKVKEGDQAHGQSLYDETCASCHGADGQTITFRFEGQSIPLGALADRDPWRFLHKTRFGTPGTDMVVGHNFGRTAQDGRDVLLYAQDTLVDNAPGLPEPALEQERVEQPDRGGPASNFFTGILTAISVMIAGLGLNILVFAVLAGMIMLLVWVVRRR